MPQPARTNNSINNNMPARTRRLHKPHGHTPMHTPQAQLSKARLHARLHGVRFTSRSVEAATRDHQRTRSKTRRLPYLAPG